MTDQVLLHVPGPDGDDDGRELERLLGDLRGELLDLDVDGVDPVADPAAEGRDGAKGLASLAGSLMVGLGMADRLRTVVGSLREWAGRTGRTVEIRLGEDVLKLTGASSDQQDKVIEAWIAAQHRNQPPAA